MSGPTPDKRHRRQPRPVGIMPSLSPVSGVSRTDNGVHEIGGTALQTVTCMKETPGSDSGDWRRLGPRLPGSWLHPLFHNMNKNVEIQHDHIVKAVELNVDTTASVWLVLALPGLLFKGRTFFDKCT